MNRRLTSRPSGEKFQTKSALHEHVRDMLVLERLCSRFHLVASQLRRRHADRPTLQVQDEDDLRDLLHALLLINHEDIRLETWIPAAAGGIPRTDFLLKLEKVILVARQARSGLSAQELGEQISLDIQRYQQHPDCQTLLCFVYDPAGYLPNPRAFENQLSQEKDAFTVRVIIAPKM